MSPESPTPPPGREARQRPLRVRPGLAPLDDLRARGRGPRRPSASSSSPRRPAATRSATASSSPSCRTTRSRTRRPTTPTPPSTTPTAHITGTLTDGTELHHHRAAPAARRRPAADDREGRRVRRRPRAQRARHASCRCCCRSLLIIGFFVWMQRRAQGQMGGDHVHRAVQGQDLLHRAARARRSPTSPATTASSRRSREVVDFLKEPEQVRGDRRPHPQGRAARRARPAPARPSSPGPSPARPACRSCRSPAPTSWRCSSASAPAGSATSSRPPASMGRAIIFVDEIDSIGRKRGAGLGGGHDEREQTLNQMLAEMDGFEATEGIVMMAATNRPDILDPALLRPGRFDRQVVVPLPELDERRAILEVHVKHKQIAPDVDLDLVARGTPGMSGADLANLVNEAALFAVRAGRRGRTSARLRGRPRPGAHGPAARVDGAVRRGEGGHRLPRGRPRRVRRACSPTPTRVHKVTILPIGHGPRRHPAAPDRGAPHLHARTTSRTRSSSRMGGRIAEELVFGVIVHRRQQRPRRRHRAGPQDGRASGA